jgi:hypothetical protein
VTTTHWYKSALPLSLSLHTHTHMEPVDIDEKAIRDNHIYAQA